MGGGYEIFDFFDEVVLVSYIENLFGLGGKVAAITGGGGYLCGEMARGLSKAGCKIAVMDIRYEKASLVADEIKRESGGEAIAVQVDATDKVSFQKSCEMIVDQLGDVDILINGAGINSPTPFLEIELEEQGTDCELTLTQTQIPEGQGIRYKNGWTEHYFEPMQAYFAENA